MPEGDSVFRLAARLRKSLDGRTLKRGDLRVPAHATTTLDGMRVTEHVTHGKHLLTRFDGGLTLHTHLLMQGSWTVTAAGRALPRRLLPDARVILEVADGPTAYGLDLPVVDLLPTAAEGDVVGYLGPDPLRHDWSADDAVRRLGRDPAARVAAALLDQRNVAGFGNLWANELCFLRGLHPDTVMADVDVPALVALGARCLRFSATRPGAHQVTTGTLRRGEQHWVVGRAGRPCLRCGTAVRVRAEVPGDPGRRRTWWCPRCQPSRSSD
ncbi:DNA-formamidopyrimidine glycosylase family protein [Arthrobacter burdickii]|uniref:DNA-(apurinic or apyrimidinic site) lyase n=1 Tax=Arthrobacter burdickii TaxID=3035920 RepID=A0ABT8JYG4_9MICC|nr:DNA-formamidopyrimidine glycosylase family protein [Arthrobacter burdickii]MDN4610209.1 DNA-formamidopyrimidine glycosylase family protein [Arthrobacter burdickii]